MNDEFLRALFDVLEIGCVEIYTRPPDADLVSSRIMQASLIAMISILVFDHSKHSDVQNMRAWHQQYLSVLTFSLEVERVWRTQETLFKVFWAAVSTGSAAVRH